MYSFVSDQPTHPNHQNRFACKFLTEDNESPTEYANINETIIWNFASIRKNGKKLKKKKKKKNDKKKYKNIRNGFEPGTL